MTFDLIFYINSRVAQLHEDKKGQTMEVKEVINNAIYELEKLKEAAIKNI
ncbi:hypothetical protein GLP30_17255 [Photobacterium phosphoreum]|uniref:Phage protein n=1 Tax=Photobacterium phosphoreum TaxID=659 RepID=A0AAW5A059_PHOPO|nr:MULTISPECIES: hypothetical protein [Photobacterium]MBY3790378.1 hypothetical protein [Photobacterium carnosum]MCD9481343.1 hypothetical protein [Photobacterium phosphoreum]MCD9485448.1 hypothetical protein [Photobacterium phosphoreum]MCD9492598.1 hypothetical protein [Photobacterium phosphoreum]MCD9512980.1 hypothetical protein [Photobacterium phosphoreum]